MNGDEGDPELQVRLGSAELVEVFAQVKNTKLSCHETRFVGRQQEANDALSKETHQSPGHPAADKIWNMDVSGEEANDALSKETHQGPAHPATDQRWKKNELPIGTPTCMVQKILSHLLHLLRDTHFVRVFGSGARVDPRRNRGRRVATESPKTGES